MSKGRMQKLLERAHVVVPEPEEVVQSPVVDVPPVKDVAVTPEQANLASGRSLEDIYSARQVPSVPYSADKLLQTLEGLKALPLDTQKVAIKAMDDAERRSVAEPVGDAQNKLQALADEQAELRTNLNGVRASNDSRVKESEDGQASRLSKIREQIAGLEAMIARETQNGAEERAKIQSETETAKKSTDAQLARLDSAASRLRTVITLFADVPPTATKVA